MRTTLILAAFAVLVPVLAWADEPPPPDEYQGPNSSHIAGLTFRHQRIRHYGPAEAPPLERHPLGFQTYVFLTDCDTSSPNCKNAEALKAVGGAVTTIDSVTIGDDVSKVETALLTKGKHTLTIALGDDVVTDTDTPRTVALVVNVP